MIRPFLNLLHDFGAISIFFGRIVKTVFRSRGYFDAVAAQVQSICSRSFLTVAVAGCFVGAIIVLQFNLILGEYDALIFLGGLNTSAVVREVGPLIISFLLAGKIGAYTAAELGTMRVTDQIEAIECLGTDPIQYLIVPRFVGIICSSVVLLLIGLVISVMGATVVAQVVCGINPLQYFSSIPKFITPWTFIGGFIQALVYGTIVAGVACHQGYSARGGARGVGKAVTMAAIYTNFYIVIANYFTTGCIGSLESWVEYLKEGLL